MNSVFLRAAFCFATLITVTALVRGAPLVEADFSRYADGPLVGQHGWLAQNATTSPVLAVVNGQVSVPFIAPIPATVIGQAARLNFPSVVNTPLTGSTSVFLSVDLCVTRTGLRDQTNVRNISFLSTGGFHNGRIVTRSGTAPGFFQFGIRFNGQGDARTGWGSDLPLNVPVQIVSRVNLVPGFDNDSVALFINPAAESELSEPYAVSQANSFTTDFGNITAVALSPLYVDGVYPQNAYDLRGLRAGLSLADVIVPEPGVATLLSLPLMLVVSRRSRRVFPKQ